ncbi:MAG: YqeG family HAD IIIA-type phosphatase [Clostridiales bacterium]|nr:MAG: YqeG family HAD IIIA-type phosphatase [Clostridiales bacterium]
MAVSFFIRGIMNKNLYPTVYLSAFHDVTPELLKKHGITGLLCDLDETLVGHNEQEINNELISWLEVLSENDIPVCIISNNTQTRTSQFARKIGVPYICMAMKPFAFKILRGADVINKPRDEVALVGDQLFTDVKAARNAGIKSILVDPMGNQSMWYVKMKRRREGKYKKEFKKEA